MLSIKKLNEYKNTLDFKDECCGKDFKNNYKFIEKAIKMMIKKKKINKL